MRKAISQYCLAAALLTLTACSGGGGGGSSSGPTQPAVSQADATRFLEQSSFGPTPAAVTQVQQMGFAAYLAQQFATPATGYSGFSYLTSNQAVGCPTGSASTCARDNYSLFPLQMQFFRNALTGPDQLRQRVALALSQLMVVSGIEVNQPYGMADYQNLLLNDAFGNYRQLLYDVTLSPPMGRYLDIANNAKANPAKGTNPNENYGREVMQLFSIGLQQLNADGTPKLDGSGNPIPTYTQPTIEGFSSVFTGWVYPPRQGAPVFPAPVNYDGQMVPVAAQHDENSKLLLNGTTLPAGQDPATDLNQALDNIFNHPNVGPFIGKQLIQQLVTSNPSPAYVSRVSAVFADNGQGVRGDLKAVVQAILLDPEARGDANTDPNFGKLREPILLITAFLRGIGGATQSDGEYLRNVSAALSQNVFDAGSVFNFYPPNYPLHGTSLVGPPFGIYDPATALTRADFIVKLLTSKIAPDATVTNATGTSLDLTAWQTAAADTGTLVTQINQLFFHGAMSGALQASLTQTVNAIPAADTADRAGAALYLALASPEFQVER
ncbi:MAG: DUF1800 domain-containing protein [Nevskia sp.]|nr:DUF1800 domain-containing protein [Nevskia sp.]